MQTGNKKMRDLRAGDVFVRDDFTYVAIADPYYGTVWVTTPEFVNEEGVYSYTSAALLQYEQDDFTGSYLSSHSLRQKSSAKMSAL